MDAPKISCYMVTKQPLISIQPSIDSFLNQSYPNKELIILSQNTENDVIKHENIQFVKVNSNKDINSMLDLSIELTTGEWLCYWSDQSISHPYRLAVQFKIGEKSCFKQCLTFVNNQLEWVDCSNVLLETLMFCKQEYHKYNGFIHTANIDLSPKVIDLGHYYTRLSNDKVKLLEFNKQKKLLVQELWKDVI